MWMGQQVRLGQLDGNDKSEYFNWLRQSSIKRWSHSHQVLVAQCIWPFDSMNCSQPGPSVHGIFQVRILEQVAISFSRGSFQPRDWSGVSCIACKCFTIWTTREAPHQMWVQMLKKIQPKTPAPYTHLAVTEAWRNTTQDKTPPAQVFNRNAFILLFSGICMRSALPHPTSFPWKFSCYSPAHPFC